MIIVRCGLTETAPFDSWTDISLLAITSQIHHYSTSRIRLCVWNINIPVTFYSALMSCMCVNMGKCIKALEVTLCGCMGTCIKVLEVTLCGCLGTYIKALEVTLCVNMGTCIKALEVTLCVPMGLPSSHQFSAYICLHGTCIKGFNLCLCVPMGPTSRH